MTATPRPPPNTFAALALDRAAERRDDAGWLAQLERAAATRYLLLDPEGKLLVDPQQERPYWLDATRRARLLGDLPASLLGLSDGVAHFVVSLDAAHARVLGLPEAARLGLRAVGSRFDAFDAGLAAYATGLVQWQAATRFCSACGAPLRLTGAGHRAQCSGDDCGRLHFPRTDPAVIMIVEHDGACLLGRQAGWPAGRYSTLAGFVEPGEALEDAVRREVAEEAGVEVGECEYHSSQPWPFPASLMIGFHARARSRAITLRDGELEDARWFTPDEIVDGVRDGSLAMSSRLSVSWRLIDDWMRRRGIDLAALSRE
ncbi:MAG TPA: NAD(+) diphosphatase [Rhodanobacteraceae bacterium]|nr:NAD(+) diphosphatase [Rhodanobacteraceae bacterium]